MTHSPAVNPHLGLNIVTDLRQLLEFGFMVNAYRAGTIVAIVAGALGWFMVLRRQAFAGHTLAVVGFTSTYAVSRSSRSQSAYACSALRWPMA